MSEKIYSDPEIGEVRLRRSTRSRRISIRVHPSKGVTVTVPWLTPYSAGIKFLLSRREWIMAVLKHQKSSTGNVLVLSVEQVEAMRRDAKAWLPGRLAFLASRYGFVYNTVSIKNNRSNWGSCSTRGNINLNLRLMAVPEPLRDYVILHELSHLKHPDHGPGFHALLESLCRDSMSSVCYEGGPDESLRAEILAASGHSRAAFPVSRLLEKALRCYRLA